MSHAIARIVEVGGPVLLSTLFSGS